MSSNYAERQIREAIARAKGNSQKARKMLSEMCADDAQLLKSLTAPHMTGILAHAIQHVSSKIAKGEPLPPEPVIPAPSQVNDGFGKELLKNLGMGKPAKFSQEHFSAPIGKKAASQKHIDAINMIAKRT